MLQLVCHRGQPVVRSALWRCEDGGEGLMTLVIAVRRFAAGGAKAVAVSLGSGPVAVVFRQRADPMGQFQSVQQCSRGAGWGWRV